MDLVPRSQRLAPRQPDHVRLGFDPLVPTVFHNGWWLEAASGGRYEEVDVRSDNRTIARLPFVIERRFGIYRACIMPEITHFLGPAIDAGSGSAVTRSLKTYHLTRELLGKLKPHGTFHQKMHRGIIDTLGFNDAGYTTLVEFTFEISPQPEQQVWREMRAKTRNVIRRAGERWQVAVWDDPEAFAALYQDNLSKRGVENVYSRVAQVCAAAIAHRQGNILAVNDTNGAVLGAIFVIWDHETAYYVLSTRTPGSDNGVISLLIWEAIRDACAQGIVFDFDGLGAAGNRLLFTGFGGRIVPRFIAARHRFDYRAAAAIHRMAQTWFAPARRFVKVDI